MGEKRSEISRLGEFGLIKHISSKVNIQNESTIVGIGDDAAVIGINGDEVVLLSTDMLVEGIHFDLSYTPIRHLGYKAVAVNVSDIAAMNGTPTQITVSLAVSNRFSMEAIDELYAGILGACENYKVDLAGGDTTSSVSGLIISITVLGKASRNKVALRSGAKVNDIICVTGDLGSAFMGLQVLEREKQVYLSNPDMQPDLEKYEYIVERILKPEARMDIIHELNDINVIPHAMIDISDGLASELLHISEMSKVGIRVMEDKIPIDTQAFETAIEFNFNPITCALNGGEDYELLFTISQDDYEKIKNHPDIHTIGFIHDDKNQNIMISKQGTVVPIQAQGWDHFRS